MSDHPIENLSERLQALAAGRESRRFWATLMVARDVETVESIRRGLPVYRRMLDPFVLARAGRGMPLSDGDWLYVTAEMLDAIAEGGPGR